MENDLISRAAALQALRQLCDTTDANIAIMPEVTAVLRELPAVDAVQIGRCGTCKKAMTKDCLLYGFDENGYCTGGPGSDYYCADYEPKEASNA